MSRGEVAWGAGEREWKCFRMGPYRSYSRRMRGAWEGGKPKRITGVGSGRGLGAEEAEGGIEVNREGVMSGGGEGANAVSVLKSMNVGGVVP
jgi:hypothetical protein